MASPIDHSAVIPPTDSSHVQRFWLWLALAGFLLVAFWPFLIWQATYYFPPFWFFSLPLTLGRFGIILLGPLLALVLLVEGWRKSRRFALMTLFVSLATTAAGSFFNPTSWWLQFNYWYFDAARAAFLNQVARGEDFSIGEYGGVQTIQNTDGTFLSQGGGDAFLKIAPEGPMILFLTFTGIPDGMSGFLYTSKPVDPKVAWPELHLEWADQWSEGKNVYFVGNR